MMRKKKEAAANSEHSLDELNPIQRAVEILFANTPGYLEAYVRRAKNAARSPESLRKLKIDGLKHEMCFMEGIAAKSGEDTGESQRIQGQIGQLEAGEDVPLLHHRKHHDYLPAEIDGASILATLKDVVLWSLCQGYAIPDSWRETIPEVERPYRNSVIDYARLVEKNVWELIEATRLVLGEVGKFEYPGEHRMDGSGHVSLGEHNYRSYRDRMKGVGGNPMLEPDFNVMFAQEFTDACDAADAKIIKTLTRLGGHTRDVEPNSYLTWVHSKGFTLPEPLRAMLDSDLITEAEAGRRLEEVNYRLSERQGRERVRTALINGTLKSLTKSHVNKWLGVLKAEIKAD